MNKIRVKYIMTIISEAIGAYELLSAEKRYLKLSQSLKILSVYKDDAQIITFYKARSTLYRQIKLFTGFFVTFLILVLYIISESLFLTIFFALVLLTLYGFIAVLVVAEKKYSCLWDDRETFMNFIKLNKSKVFEPQHFDEIINLQAEMYQVEQKLSFEDECNLLSRQKNAFNEMDMQAVVSFFRITVIDSNVPENLQKVTMLPEDFVSFIKARFVDNSDTVLQIKLISGDKSHVKALFHCFYTYNCEFYGEKKKSQAKRYSELYLNSFDLFDKVDYSNFSENLALDYSKSIKAYLHMKK